MLNSFANGTNLKSFGLVGALFAGTAALTVAATPPVTAEVQPSDETEGLRGFASGAELDVFAAKMAARERARRADSQTVYSVAIDAPAEAEAPADAGESITNTQEAGVDEGGIVKNVGDYLVVLRRGRLFTIHTGDGDLEPIDAIDAFPPEKENPGNTWYDEMLVRDGQVIVIGYSYGNFGTEVNRFDVSESGELTYRDTHYMRSGDYYSSSNYASRLIGDELILYTPVYANWEDLDASLPAIREFGESGEQVLVKPQDFLVAEPYRSGRFKLGILHTVTRCDLSTPELECSATAIAGTWSRAFYVSRQAVYAWTGTAQTDWRSTAAKTPGQLYRIPLDGSRPGAVQIAGAPVDQFSFAEDADEEALRILLRGVGNGEGMWASEFSVGDVSLATIPFDQFGRGNSALGQGAYRALPEVEGWRFQNRFVGDYVLYSAAAYANEDETPFVFAVPLDGRDVQKITLRHGVTRFDRMGSDGVAVGPSSDGALGFTSLSLGPQAKVEHTYMLPGASEGETRSQAFFYKPDRGSAGGLTGTLGLPISRQIERDGAEFLGSGSAIAFLRRENRSLSPAGELAARTENARDDNCIASCVDWYGNARPIFMKGRIFALMGYEIVEGDLRAGRMEELRRTNFTP